jgi:hypothetical protein
LLHKEVPLLLVIRQLHANLKITYQLELGLNIILLFNNFNETLNKKILITLKVTVTLMNIKRYKS